MVAGTWARPNRVRSGSRFCADRPGVHNWDTDSYDLGNAYGHIALEVDDVYEACDQIRRRGGTVTREPGPMKHGTTVLAFVEDPDGYKVELLGAR